MSLPKGSLNKPLKTSDIMKTPFVLFQAHPDDYNKMVQQSEQNVHNESILEKAFFHPKNIDIVQKQIIMEVFRISNGEYLIEKQNENDLRVVMDAIFFEHAKHLPYNIREQITELNSRVVDDVVPGIISEIKSYFGYLDRAFGPMQVMDRPKNVSNAGSKTLPSFIK